MKVYTIEEGRIFSGAHMSARFVGAPDKSRWLSIGGGRNTIDVPVFKKNVPEIDTSRGPWGGTIREAYPVSVASGYAIAKPNQPSDKILVVLKTRRHGYSKRGYWSWESSFVPTSDGMNQVLVCASGPADYHADQQSARNIGWTDGLVVMKVGDVIMTVDQKGDITIAQYKSVEEGLVKIEK